MKTKQCVWTGAVVGIVASVACSSVAIPTDLEGPLPLDASVREGSPKSKGAPLADAGVELDAGADATPPGSLLDGGRISDGGAQRPDGAAACYQPNSATRMPWRGAPAIHQGKCSVAQVSDFAKACDVVTSSACQTFVQEPRNHPCLRCAVGHAPGDTNATVSSLPPPAFLPNPAAFSSFVLNNGACGALVLGSSSCATILAEQAMCIATACGTCGSHREYEGCREFAPRPGAICQSNSATAACEQVYNNSTAMSACGSSVDGVQKILTTMCGS